MPTLVAATLLIALAPLAAIADPASSNAVPYIYVLGIAQDAGYPQANCYRPYCMRAWQDPTLKRLASSITVIDGARGANCLFDATPDIREQLYRLHVEAPDDTHRIGGVFLTHDLMDHYTGLMHFGHEAIGAKGILVFAMPRMQEYLRDNGPWSQLVRLRNIEIVLIRSGEQLTLSEDLAFAPIQVPHRDEYTETVGYKTIGPDRSALVIPDIDKWNKWSTDIRDLISDVDYALLDATFFADGELPGRNMSEIGHPLVQESIELFAEMSKSDEAKVKFIHFNHTNPLLIDGSDAQKQITSLGFRLATEGMRLPL